MFHCGSTRRQSAPTLYPNKPGAILAVVHMRAGRRCPKSEPARTTEIRISKPECLAPYWAFELSEFQFVSEFGFRALVLSCPKMAACPMLELRQKVGFCFSTDA